MSKTRQIHEIFLFMLSIFVLFNLNIINTINGQTNVYNSDLEDGDNFLGWSEKINLNNQQDILIKSPQIITDSDDDQIVIFPKKNISNDKNYFQLIKLINGNKHIKIINKVYTNSIIESYVVDIDSDGNIVLLWCENFSRGLNLNILNRNGDSTLNKTFYPFNCLFVENPSIVIDSSDNIHCTWFEELNESNQNNVCYMKINREGNILIEAMTTTSNGSIWAPPIHPSISIDSHNNAFIIWKEIANKTEVMMLAGIDATGNLFLKKRIVEATLIFYHKPQIIIDSNDFINVIWGDINPNIGIDRTNILLSRFDNKGMQMIESKFLLEVDPIMGISLDIDSMMNFHLALGTAMIYNYTITKSRVNYGYHLHYFKFNYNGQLLSNPLKFIRGIISSREGFPSISIDDIGNIHIVWQATSINSIYYIKNAAYYVNIDKSNVSNNNKFIIQTVDSKILKVNITIQNFGSQDDFIFTSVSNSSELLDVNLSKRNIFLESGEGKNVTLTFLLKDLKNEDKNFILDIICKSANDHNAIDNITLHLNFLFNDQNENRENDSDMFTLFLYSALLIVVIAILFIFFKLKKSKDRL